MPPMSYDQIAADLTRRIAAGQFGDGKLPTYDQMATHYNASRSTIASAIRLLRDRGIVVGSPGRGVYVADRPPTR